MPSSKLQTSATPMVLPLQLPLWPNKQRGIPNAMARSALFNVTNLRAGARKSYERRVIAAVGGIGITYTGFELRQDDADVLLQILHLARPHDLGTHVSFTGHSLLKSLTWSINNASKERLISCLSRLSATTLDISITDREGLREGYAGSLIRSFFWRDDSTGKALRNWSVLLEPKIAALFLPSSYSRLDWELRMSLPPLAKWLHTFYQTHSMPFPMKVETIHRLTDSDAKELWHFRADLKKALGLLVDKSFFISAVIDPRTDTVQVVRKHQIEA
jgi:hypothetical protein